MTGTCPIIVTRTYTVADACGNTSTVTQTINVDDQTAPVITGAIAATTVEGCDATALPAAATTTAALEALGVSIADACTPDASLVVTSTDASTGTCPIIVTRTYTVADACGNTSTVTQTINVDDQTAPVITGAIAATTVEGCDATALPAAATTTAALEALGVSIADACTPDASLVVTSTDASTGTCPIIVTRTYTVADACGNTSTVTQTINVDDQTAPVITGAIAATTVEGCDATALPAAATTTAALEALGVSIADACTPDASLVVTSTDASTGTCPIIVTRTYTVADACGNTSTVTQTINVDDQTAPVITGAIAATTVEGCDATALPAAATTTAALEALGVSIADACTPDASLVVTSTDASTGTCPIIVTRTYTVADACGNTSTVTQTINVDDQTAPVITGAIAATTVEGCDATALPAAATTTAALEALGVSIADACTPDASLVVTSTDASTGTCPIIVTRTYTVADACGNTSTVTQTINVDDQTAPVITGAIAATTVEGCDATALPATATTTAALEALGVSIADACTPDASLVVTSTDASTGTCPIIVTRTYTVADACGNTSTVTQTINVDDQTAPVITGAIAATTVEGCDATALPAAATTTAALEALGVSIADACTPDASLVVTDTDASTGTCPIIVTRTYTVADACGNTSTVTQTINVDDQTAPVITGAIAATTVEGCDATALPAAATTTAALEALGVSIADACTPDASLVVTSTDASTGTCPIIVTRTYTVADACGNTSTVTQTINVDDQTALLLLVLLLLLPLKGVMLLHFPPLLLLLPPWKLSVFLLLTHALPMLHWWLLAPMRQRGPAQL